MRFDIAPIVVWIFELPLDQEIRAASVIRILLGLEGGLVVVAIAKDRSGYVVGVKVHDSPQLHGRVRKAYRDPGDLKPRHRGSDTHTFGGHTGLTLREVGSDSGEQDSLANARTARRSGPKSKRCNSAVRGGGGHRGEQKTPTPACRHPLPVLISLVPRHGLSISSAARAQGRVALAYLTLPSRCASPPAKS